MDTAANHPQMQPRTIMRTTTLVRNGRCPAAIIYPGQEPAYADLAGALATSIEQYGNARPQLFADNDVIPSINIPLPDRFRQQPLILLGSLNSNRALLSLYANYYCATDATYPGGNGFDLRTIVNPYGTDANVILAGGSTLSGVKQAVERLIARINEVDDKGELVLPFMLEVDLAPELAQLLDRWPGAPLKEQRSTKDKDIDTIDEMTRQVGAYGMLYAWTGDERYGQFAADTLRALNVAMTDSYGDWHYHAERILRALPWLLSGGFLNEKEILRVDTLLLGTALGTQDMWWRMRHGRPPLGHRHHGRGTYEFFLLARYLLDQASPNDAARRLCQRWLHECRQFLDALARAGIDDQDDEATLNNLATLYWYALGDERFEFFESGNARLVAQRAIALHDNMGAGAGQGGYGEGLPGAMYLQQEATVPVAACALYHRDGRFKWILERLPNLKTPIRHSFLSFSPLFMHKFDTGPELSPTEPLGLTGLQVLPVTSHQQALSNRPPEHVEPLGHSVNAPETWLLPEGIGINTLPREQGFDKIVLRSAFAPEATYLLLQGYQGGYRWQGHMQAANCIVRFSQGGHIFLIQNTTQHSLYYKNGVFVSDGYNDTPLPPIAEWLAVDDFTRVGLSITRLNDYHHTDWVRHIFWSKTGDGFFVVIDAVTPKIDGPYSLICTWRTPGYACLEGRSWQTRQGSHRFTLRSCENLRATNEAEETEGAAHPYVLRQFREGNFRAGECITFQNIFHVRRQDAADDLDIRQLGAGQALVIQDGTPIAWCEAGANQEMGALGLKVCAGSVWITGKEIVLASATHLALEDAPGWRFQCDRPFGLFLDLSTAQATVRVDGPGDTPIEISVELGEVTATVLVERHRSISIDLPVDECWRLAHRLQASLHGLSHSDGKSNTMEPRLPESRPGRWRSLWLFDRWTLLPERIRDVTVDASLAPVNGFAEQLIDTVLPESRETWQQWPVAPTYDMTLTFPEEVALDHLRIVGDSKVEPTLHTFHPLPQGIAVNLSNDGFRRDVRVGLVDREPGVLRYQRYRGTEDRMETRRVDLGGQTARQIRIHVPAPPKQRPLVLHEIEIYGTKRVLPQIRYLWTGDLTGDGRQEIVLVNAADELVVLSDDGQERWRQRLPAPATHLSCHDLNGDGRRSICLGILGGNLRILSPEGTLIRSLPLAERLSRRSDIYFGWLYSINSTAVWRREPDGRAALAVGGYAVLVFLNPEGEIVGHSWADGPWLTDLVPVPSDQSDAFDMWARLKWNHGVCVYEGREGLAPSGETILFGGVEQPMFRALQRVIPFVTGRTVTFHWQKGEDRGGYILAAAEMGVGVLSVEERDWRWKIEGGTPITACIGTKDRHGPKTVIVGGADGYVTAFTWTDGRPLQRLSVGAPVTGICSLSQASALAVATRSNVLTLDNDWRISSSRPLSTRRMVGLGTDTALVERADATLELLRWSD